MHKVASLPVLLDLGQGEDTLEGQGRRLPWEGMEYRGGRGQDSCHRCGREGSTAGEQGAAQAEGTVVAESRIHWKRIVEITWEAAWISTADQTHQTRELQHELRGQETSTDLEQNISGGRLL